MFSIWRNRKQLRERDFETILQELYAHFLSTGQSRRDDEEFISKFLGIEPDAIFNRAVLITLQEWGYVKADLRGMLNSPLSVTLTGKGMTYFYEKSIRRKESWWTRALSIAAVVISIIALFF